MNLPKRMQNGVVYFVDSRLKQVRNIENPHDFQDFTEEGLAAFIANSVAVKQVEATVRFNIFIPQDETLEFTALDKVDENTHRLQFQGKDSCPLKHSMVEYETVLVEQLD